MMTPTTRAVLSAALAVVAAVALLAAPASGFVDFHGLSHPATRVERADGMVEWNHDVHHVFPETATFFKAKYHAVHHKRWHFVELHKHVDFMRDVGCGSGEEELFVTAPPAGFVAELGKQSYQHTVLVAHPRFHCGQVGIFRRVNNATLDAATNTLRLDTAPLKYEHVYETLNFVMDTNHLPHEIVHAPARDAFELDQIAKAKRAAAMEDVQRRHPESRRMGQQNILAFLGNAVKKAVAVATTVVKKTVEAVTETVKVVKSIAQGEYKGTHSLTLAKVNYNNDVVGQFNRWNIVGAAKAAASMQANLAFHFALDIQSYKLYLAEAYLSGDFKAGVRGAFSASVKKDIEAELEIAEIKLQTISFSIGPVPVVVVPSIPISVGFSLEISGSMETNVLLAADGYIKQGMRYTKESGLGVVNDKSFNFIKDFTPLTFQYEIGVTAWVMAQLYLQINFLGGPYAGLKVAGEALIQNNRDCRMLLNINLQPIIVAGAKIDISVAGFTVYEKEWGPMPVWSTKIPLFRLCLPKENRASHGFLEQQASSAVTTTVATELSANFTGTVWYGTSNCANNGSRPLAFSAQFTTGDDANSTVLIITIAQNVSVGNGTYEQSNLQRSYQFLEPIRAGMLAKMVLLNGTKQVEFEDVMGNSSAAVAPVIEDYMWFAVSANDTRVISLNSSMVCGNVTLESRTMTNDNSSFTVFAAGGGEPESFFDKAKPYLVYAPVLGAVVVVAVVAGVVISRRRRQQRAAAKHFTTDASAEAKFDENRQPML